MNDTSLPSGDLEFRRWTRIRSVVMECLRKSDTPGGYERHSAFAEATTNEIMERLSSLELETEQPKDAPEPRKRRPHHLCPGPNCDERDVSKWVDDGVFKPTPAWLPEVNTVEYRNRIMPHLRQLLSKIDVNNGVVFDSNVRCFMDLVLTETQTHIEALHPTIQASDDLRKKLKDWADRPRFFGDRYVREGYDIAVDDVRRILNDAIPQIEFGDMPP